MSIMSCSQSSDCSAFRGVSDLRFMHSQVRGKNLGEPLSTDADVVISDNPLPGISVTCQVTDCVRKIRGGEVLPWPPV